MNEIWYFHSSKNVERRFLSYLAVQSWTWLLTFKRNIPPPSSGQCLLPTTYKSTWRYNLKYHNPHCAIMYFILITFKNPQYLKARSARRLINNTCIIYSSNFSKKLIIIILQTRNFSIFTYPFFINELALYVCPTVPMNMA